MRRGGITGGVMCVAGGVWSEAARGRQRPGHSPLHNLNHGDGRTTERGRRGEKREEEEEIRLRSMGMATAGAAHGLLLPRSHACLLLIPFLISPIIIPRRRPQCGAPPFQSHQSHLSILQPSLFPSACSQAHVPPIISTTDVRCPLHSAPSRRLFAPDNVADHLRPGPALAPPTTVRPRSRPGRAPC